jgi:5'-nucleotidase
MAYPIEKKFVIAVSSSALFNLMESDSIFKAQGETAYRKYQEENIDIPFDKGVAFPFIKRILSLNDSFPEEKPIEVVLFSKNNPETGLRAFRSIKYYKLDISRAYFSSGKENFQYLPAFNASLFLSANEGDTKKAIEAGYAAGTVLKNNIIDDDKDKELRLGFDFDGVIADDTSENFFEASNGNMDKYFEHESQLATSPLAEGPIGDLLKKISFFQKLEKKKAESDSKYKRIIGCDSCVYLNFYCILCRAIEFLYA